MKMTLFMNVRTGEFKEKEVMVLGTDVEVNRKPKSSCKKCYGQGYIGRATQDGRRRGKIIIVKGNLVPCRCVLKE